MSSFGLLSIGTRALNANYAALQTTGHNIANANVEGYSRQTVELATSAPELSGGGYIGKGVDIETVSRSHSAFLTQEANQTQSVASADQARLDMLQKMESVFGTGEGGLGYVAGQFLNGLSALASQPGDASTRQVVMGQASNVASRFDTAAKQLESIQTDVATALTVGVQTVNGLAKSVAEVNERIVAALRLGQPPNDLLDQRDLLVSKLSDLIQVTQVEQKDGSVSLFVAGGQALVVGPKVSELVLTQDPYDPRRSALGLTNGGATRDLDPATLGYGQLAGWLQFQNDDLVQGRLLLGQMASALGGAINLQQSLGLDLGLPPQAGGPLFALGAPLAQPRTSNQQVDGSGNPVAAVSVAVTDASQLPAREFVLAHNGATWTLQALSAGVPDGAAIDLSIYETTPGSGVFQLMGFSIDVNGIALTAGQPTYPDDSYLVQPVSYAALGMSRALDDFRGLAAASPAAATTDPNNNGTMAVVSVGSVDPSWTQTIAADMNSATPQTSYFTVTFGANGQWSAVDLTLTDPLDVTSGVFGNYSTGPLTGTWVPGQALIVGGLSLNLTGVPAAGDTISIDPTQFTRQNNGNALALASLRDALIVGRNSSGLGGDSLTDAYAGALADVGVRVNGAKATAQLSNQIAVQAEQRRADAAGVNLDEEASRLIQFQQSYQAAARVLQIAQGVFDSLLQATSG